MAVDRVVGWRRAMCQGDLVSLFPGKRKRTKAGHRSESMAETRVTAADYTLSALFDFPAVSQEPILPAKLFHTSDRRKRHYLIGREIAKAVTA